MLHVENMRGVDAATWDGLLLQSPGGGHVLQTYTWGEIKTTQGWKPLRLALKDGDRVVGVGQVRLRQPPDIFGVVAYYPQGTCFSWANGWPHPPVHQGLEAYFGLSRDFRHQTR